MGCGQKIISLFSFSSWQTTGSLVLKGRYIQTLDWTTGMDYWTDIFLVFTHVVVG